MESKFTNIPSSIPCDGLNGACQLVSEGSFHTKNTRSHTEAGIAEIASASVSRAGPVSKILKLIDVFRHSSLSRGCSVSSRNRMQPQGMASSEVTLAAIVP